MKTVYAIELNDQPSSDDISFLNDKSGQFYEEELLIIFHSAEKFIEAEQYFQDNQVLEDCYELVHLKQAEITPLFEDYGFIIDEVYYLIKNSVFAFNIVSGEATQIEMALFQIEEFLISTENVDGQFFYFVDIHQRELIQRFANAYEIELSLLDLDK
ncbi:hypothetical protein [Litchfieldia alkalitelluris]|uniref:hypothetical protein n=1 Tax=Litchfieldia alkalitelluris TaxID=304268 RepID=UPI000997F431|nr:hypothetical protein [Litchfieldia alkalitelluris]